MRKYLPLVPPVALVAIGLWLLASEPAPIWAGLVTLAAGLYWWHQLD